MRLLVALALLLAGCASPIDDPDPTPAEGFGLDLWADDLDDPVAFALHGERVLVGEQAGRVYSFAAEGDEPTLFLDIRDITGSQGNEQGLLGIAIAPDDRAYVHYTDLDGDTVLSRFAINGDHAVRLSQEILLQVEQPYSNHNGGRIAFGPDGYLYMGLGDGGSANDPDGNGQDTTTLLGSLLRIDVRPTVGYVVPTDNPFFVATGADEIYAYGLRNPWQFSFDGEDLWLADVGQNRWEEVNHLPAAEANGANFGWPIREGRHGDALPGAIDPVHEYSHDNSGCSVTGGAVYRGATLPALVGHYLYGDYCLGDIWSFDGTEAHDVASINFGLSAFGATPDGEVLIADHAQGKVYQLVAA